MKTYAEVEGESLRLLADDYRRRGEIRQWNRVDRKRAERIHRHAVRLLSGMAPEDYGYGKADLKERLAKLLKQKRQLYQMGGLLWIVLSAFLSVIIQKIVEYLIDQLFGEYDALDAYTSREQQAIVGYWKSGAAALETQD